MAIYCAACRVPASLSLCRASTRSSSPQNCLGFVSFNGLCRVKKIQCTSLVRIASSRKSSSNAQAVDGLEVASQYSGDAKLIRIRRMRQLTCSASARQPFPWGQEHPHDHDQDESATHHTIDQDAARRTLSQQATSQQAIAEQALAQQQTIAQVISALNTLLRVAERTKERVDELSLRLDDHLSQAGHDAAWHAGAKVRRASFSSSLEGVTESRHSSSGQREPDGGQRRWSREALQEEESNRRGGRVQDTGRPGEIEAGAGAGVSAWEASRRGAAAPSSPVPSKVDAGGEASGSSWKAQAEFWRAQAAEGNRAAEAMGRQLQHFQVRVAKLEEAQQRAQERGEEADYWRAQAAQATQASRSMAEDLRRSNARVAALARQLDEVKAAVQEQAFGREQAQAKAAELGQLLQESRGKLEQKDELLARASQSAAKELQHSQARAAELEQRVQKAEEMLKRDTDGRTAMHLAARRGDLDAVRLCVKMGDDVNARDKGKYTPLMLAAIRGHHNIVLLLVESGADVNAKDYLGDTALHWARKHGHLQVAWLLEEHSAAH